ncbi:MAG: hypothetical protein EXR55_00580 [Dehalococcoidia bacterium]|nr:hypothetical protein [Dehalococcoidia bacterium]
MRKRLLLLLLLVAVAFLAPRASLNLSPVQQAVFPYRWDLVGWEVANLFGKWWLLGQERVLGHYPTRDQGLKQVEEFFRLGNEERALLGQRLLLAAGGQQTDGPGLQEVEATLARAHRGRARLRPAVEEALEREVSGVLRREGIFPEVWGVSLLFPPVDFRFDTPPLLLIMSPRERIERLDLQVLLRPTMIVKEMEGLEGQILASQNLSALVEGTGGLSTYPAAVPATYDLRTTLHVVAHEWLHHYLFFKPLGRSYGENNTLLTLNETVADVAGRELGDLVYERLGGTLPPKAPPRQEGVEEAPQGFVFEREMRETRLQADRLLAKGKVAEAETFMEERRRFFLANGVYIRKLNQAYFAFHGSYGDSPASVSPAGNELEELRATFPSVGSFVRAVAGVYSYEEFQALLRQRQAVNR